MDSIGQPSPFTTEQGPGGPTYGHGSVTDKPVSKTTQHPRSQVQNLLIQRPIDAPAAAGNAGID